MLSMLALSFFRPLVLHDVQVRALWFFFFFFSIINCFIDYTRLGYLLLFFQSTKNIILLDYKPLD